MYYVIEHQIRPDGVVNVSEVGRATFAAALSHYYERQSKLVMNDVFTFAHLMLVDETLTVIKNDHVDTLYEPKDSDDPQVYEPKEEPTPEPTPTPEPEPEEEDEESGAPEDENGTPAEEEEE